jgi:hypothetical protein
MEDIIESNHKKQRLVKCIMMNVMLLIIIIIFIAVFKNTDNSYLRIGPHSDLVILGIKIDNIKKYVLLQLLLLFIIVTDVIINEIASPIFRI